MIDQTVLITYTFYRAWFRLYSGTTNPSDCGTCHDVCTKVGIATGAGITVGDIIHTVMAVVGISAVIAASATPFSAVKYLGAAYLVFLG